MRSTVQKEIERMVNMGVIRWQASAFCSPLTIVKKKDGSVRICLDARSLNTPMIPDNETPEGIQELLQRFYNVKF